MSTMTERYRIEVQYDAWDQNDPIPWAYAVIDGETPIEGGWAGTESEAREYAQEWLDRYTSGDWDFDD